MKKPLIAITLLAGAVSGYSQGSIVFSDYVGGGLAQQIFNVQPTAPSGATAATVTYGGYTEMQYLGSTGAANEYPQGPAVYAAGTALTGTGFDAQIFAAAGVNDAINALSPQGITQNFYSSPAPASVFGFIKGSHVVSTIPIDQNGYATIAIAVWNDGDGAYTTLAAAQEAGEPWGFSNTATITTAIPPLPLPLTIESFSLGIEVPEPSTIMLSMMGAAGFLFRRRSAGR